MLLDLLLICYTFAAGAASAAVQMSSAERLPGCGELDIIFTGLPPYHPLVTNQGYNATAVDQGLRADAADIIASGYNLRVVLMGPEQNISILSDQMSNIEWDATGVGFGVRGSNLVNMTVRFTDIIDLYRHEAPYAPTLFDYSPITSLWAIQSRFPLSENCTNSPGTDLGFEIFCDPSVCVE